MKGWVLVLFAALVASCASQPRQARFEVDEVATGHCDELVGAEWVRSEPPANAEDLLPMVDLQVVPAGFVWYSGGPGAYRMCALAQNREGCGYSAHEFRQLPDQGGLMWSYLSGAARTKTCP